MKDWDQLFGNLPDEEKNKNQGQEDSDDFVYTTNRPLFDFLKLQKINVVLQSKESFVDDGSMSVYCELNKIQYANIETQHGHLSKQLKLLAEIVKFFEL